MPHAIAPPRTVLPPIQFAFAYIASLQTLQTGITWMHETTIKADGVEFVSE
jgi:hypothetical protein